MAKPTTCIGIRTYLAGLANDEDAVNVAARVLAKREGYPEPFSRLGEVTREVLRSHARSVFRALAETAGP
jgi:hypothetical protein